MSEEKSLYVINVFGLKGGTSFVALGQGQSPYRYGRPEPEKLKRMREYYQNRFEIEFGHAGLNWIAKKSHFEAELTVEEASKIEAWEGIKRVIKAKL